MAGRHNYVKIRQLRIRATAYEREMTKAEKAGDMTAWDDARRNVEALEREIDDLEREMRD